jgi:Protein of unknown function DUF262
MRYRPRVLSVNDVYEWYQRKELSLNPDFQRRPVWSPQARSYFVDTMLCGYPIPAIQIRQLIDPGEQKTRREVVDGQQRLRALFNFLEGELRILPSQSERFGGMFYEDLPESTQHDLLDYELPVAMLSGASDEDVLSVFARLNSYTIVLNAQEKLNAKYFGRFKQTVYRLGAEHNKFWLRHSILTKRAITRMGEADLATELLVAMLKGVTDKRSVIEPTYKEFDDEFPGERKAVKQFRETIDMIEDLFGPMLEDTQFRRRPLFYSLFCVIYDRLFGLPGSAASQGPIRSSKRKLLQRHLIHLSDEVETDEPTRKYAPFNIAAQRQTDNVGPRTTRIKVIRKELEPHFS